MWKVASETDEQANGEPLRAKSRPRALLRITAIIALSALVVLGFVVALAFVISFALSYSDSVARTRSMAEVGYKIAAIQHGRSNSFVLYEVSGADALLETVAGLPGLEEVGLDRTDVTDAGIGYLAAVPSLRQLLIHWCPHVTDATLDHVSAMPALEHLALWDLAVTDRGIGALRRCSTLRRLEILAGDAHSCRLTPLAIIYLGEVSQLDVLEIEGNWVTKEAIEKLHQSLPNTTIIAHVTGKTAVLGERKAD